MASAEKRSTLADNGRPKGATKSRCIRLPRGKRAPHASPIPRLFHFKVKTAPRRLVPCPLDIVRGLPYYYNFVMAYWRVLCPGYCLKGRNRETVPRRKFNFQTRRAHNPRRGERDARIAFFTCFSLSLSLSLHYGGDYGPFYLPSSRLIISIFFVKRITVSFISQGISNGTNIFSKAVRQTYPPSPTDCPDNVSRTVTRLLVQKGKRKRSGIIYLI